jgi:hypothetical protein
LRKRADQDRGYADETCETTPARGPLNWCSESGLSDVTPHLAFCFREIVVVIGGALEAIQHCAAAGHLAPAAPEKRGREPLRPHATKGAIITDPAGRPAIACLLTDDTEQRGSFVEYDGLLHSADGTVVYVSRYQDPWKSQRKNE